MQAHAKQYFAQKQAAGQLNGLGQLLGLGWQRAVQANTLQLAASLTFTTVLSIVPLLAVALSLFTAFPLFKEFSDALQAFLINSLMPPSVSDNIMSYLNEFAAQASRLTAIGGGFLVLTVVSLIMSVESALNTLWRVDRQRRVTHRLLVYWAVITLGPVLTGASLYATAFLARESLGLLAHTPILLEIALKLLPALLGALAFAALFIVVPNTRVNRGDALVGGMISALILEAMKIGFAYYVTQFSTYTMIYGAFAALPVFLIWVYLCWLGILVGALVAANLPLLRLGRLDPEIRPGAALMDALSLLKELSDARNHRPPGCSNSELIQRLRLPLNVLEQRLSCLSAMGLVAVVPGANNDRWLLACDPVQATLGPLVDQLALDRSSIKLSERPSLALALSQLITHQADPTLEDVLAHHDSTLTHPLQSTLVSGNAGDKHAKSQ
ncbi:MAG: YihY family inner membrane protein [Alcaligenaceae bacterium]